MNKKNFRYTHSFFSTFLLVCLFFASLGFVQKIQAQCSPDVTPPVAICEAGIQIELSNTGTAIISPSDIDDGSYDNCAQILDFRLEDSGSASTSPPTTTSVTYNSVGNYDVILWVLDTEGNANQCFSSITVEDCKNPPALTCNDFIQVALSPANVAELDANVILEGTYCTNGWTYLVEVDGDPLNPMPTPTVIVDSTDYLDTLIMTVYAYQGSTPVYTNACWGHVLVDKALWLCNPDVTNPTALANSNLTVALDPNTNAGFITADQVDNGSYDYCSAVTYGIFESNSAHAVGIPTDTIFYDSNDQGIATIGFIVTDAAGNTKTVFLPVYVGGGCLGDVLAPNVLAPANITIDQNTFDAVDLQDQAAVNAAFGTATGIDNCGIMQIIEHYTIINGNCGTSSLNRAFVAIDSAFNQSAPATQIITVQGLPTYGFHLPSDFEPNDPVLDSMYLTGTTSALSMSFADVVYDYDCQPGADYIIRTWTVVSWCEANPNVAPSILPRIDFDADGVNGDAYEVVTTTTQLVTVQGNPPFTVAPRNGIYEYEQHIRYSYADTATHTIEGVVFQDANQSCSLDSGEPLMESFTVIAIGSPSNKIFTSETDVNGFYSIDICLSDTSVSLVLDLPYNYGGNSCSTTYNVAFTTVNISETISQDIGTQLDNECPLMYVDLASPRIRPCFPGYYAVNYANVSLDLIEDVNVEVVLDDDLSFVSASVPSILIAPQTYSFDVGNLDSGEDGQFILNFFTSCNALNGATHCTEAHIYPDTLCPNSPFWSGAQVEVDGFCVNDSLYFSILNTGASANSQSLDFVVVEDVIMRQTGTFSLMPGEVLNLAPIKANGATFRLQADQEHGHPYGGMPSVSIEGCAGFTPGMVLQFPTNNANPFIAVECQENVNSFDPNDKLANPRGYGSEHSIEANTEIEYTIRFQNTGNDTAYTVVILDTISAYMMPNRVQTGAASHDFRLEILEDNVLKFTFDNINLPDSTTNFAASEGFVQFRLPQMLDNPIGMRIENTAAIYFDYNEAIFTNTTFHTVAEDFLQVSGIKNYNAAAPLHIYPNPAQSEVFFDAKGVDLSAAKIQILDAQGKLVRSTTIATWPYRFERQDLADGLYFFQIQDEKTGLLYSGKLMLR